ncbi:hypothetical protein GCM10022247_69600 [Allokutzneria multivorans]|uniref:Uncharacterized protein n=1 Tax=Allokutzneria multivorans TaxID=1142134 RepID=A0ABP7U1U6_9PSEU
MKYPNGPFSAFKYLKDPFSAFAVVIHYEYRALLRPPHSGWRSGGCDGRPELADLAQESVFAGTVRMCASPGPVRLAPRSPAPPPCWWLRSPDSCSRSW